MSSRIVHPVGRAEHLPYLPGVLEAAENAGASVAVMVWNETILADVRAVDPSAVSVPGARLRDVAGRFLASLPDDVTVIGRVDDDVTPTPNLLTSLDLGGHDAVCAWPFAMPVPDYPATCMGGVHLARRDAVTELYRLSFPAWSLHVDAVWQGTYTQRDIPGPEIEAEMRRRRNR